MNFLFILGREPNISMTEIEAVCHTLGISFQIISQYKNQLILQMPDNHNPQLLMDHLGGTIKISECLESKKTVVDTIVDRLKQNSKRKIYFSISGKKTKCTAIIVKKELQACNMSVRYIVPKNTATVLYNHLVTRASDFMIIDDNVYLTRAIQPMEDFAIRDYSRPCIDSKNGMLPPKLARILINLTEKKPNCTLLDPFCGSGTLLMEAMMLGFSHSIGSDISQKAVNNTKKNLAWLKKKELLPNNQEQILHSDIQNLKKIIVPCSIDTIVTEPYMGKPLHKNETQSMIKKQIIELITLYTHAFQIFYTLLKKDGVVIFVIPEFHLNNNQIIRVNCIEQIQRTGLLHVPWSNNQDYLTYHRPHQYIARTIWRFVKK